LFLPLFQASDDLSGTYHLRIVAAFLPEKSWVDQSVRTQPDVSQLMLAHEQTHFDLAELQARRSSTRIATCSGGTTRRRPTAVMSAGRASGFATCRFSWMRSSSMLSPPPELRTLNFELQT
jgi:hypothetical protein